ncbi:hypothetical protein EA756_06385 [Acinetobacter lactucae]|uniref:Uncharacterized protein n=1 Tax=Acinetobacter lactucae TaxID=1785128 RepID=A0A3R9Y4A7_9GAMM|nr:hypothetical protein [Acinetobacter lactucae]RSO58810.1 hypothetical protein EA756_06385 [Acinetobacter lactucae]
MKQQKILDLINASQALIKSDLLPNSATHKYQLLMLIKTFEILRAYIEQGESLVARENGILQDYFHFPIQNFEDAFAQLCSDLREDVHIENVQQLLQDLNREDLKITEPKKVSHG